MFPCSVFGCFCIYFLQKTSCNAHWSALASCCPPILPSDLSLRKKHLVIIHLSNHFSTSCSQFKTITGISNFDRMVSVASRVCNMLRYLLVGVWNGSITFSFRQRYPRMLYDLFWLSRSQVVDTGRRTPLTSLTSVTTACNSTQRSDFQERSPQRQQAIRRPKSSIARSQQW